MPIERERERERVKGNNSRISIFFCFCLCREKFSTWEKGTNRDLSNLSLSLWSLLYVCRIFMSSHLVPAPLIGSSFLGTFGRFSISPLVVIFLSCYFSHLGERQNGILDLSAGTIIYPSFWVATDLSPSGSERWTACSRHFLSDPSESDFFFFHLFPFSFLLHAV